MTKITTETKDPFYTKKFDCPVCGQHFTTQKVKSGAVRTKFRDSDMYTQFIGEDPSWYEVIVCPNCGYSAFEAGFQEISPGQKLIIEQTVRPKWHPKDFGGVRSLQDTIQVHMLAMVCYQVIGAKKSVLGKLCLRLAWLHRGVDGEKERSFMESAVRNLEEAYSTERLDEDKGNEANVMYLLGELSRRLGRYQEAMKWFGILTTDPELKKIRHINLKAREQMSQTREDYGQAKGGTP